MLIKFWFWAYI